jgi:hypothetical protein
MRMRIAIGLAVGWPFSSNCDEVPCSHKYFALSAPRGSVQAQSQLVIGSGMSQQLAGTA